MKISKLAILVVLSLWQGAALAEAEKLCRVAGIYINQNKSFAIVELPDGKYLLVHEGDTFAEGRILEISSQGLRIASPAGEQRLYLTSLSCHPVDTTNSTDKTDNKENTPNNIVLEEKDAGNSSIRRVAVEPMRNELNRLSSSLPNTANKTDHSAAKNNSDAKDSNPDSELSTLLKPLVNLPGGSKIVDIDHMPITSTKDALAHIDEALSRGSVVRLSIEGVPGQDGVYIMPQLKR